MFNTIKFNVWIRQPLLAANWCAAEYHQIEYRVSMYQEGENTKNHHRSSRADL